ncbi:MAG: hypothetical protein JNM94_08410 [Phycisphaerae bacterium]|nr:hypothetical protein [Phycisphaerae bacterium]
MHDSPDHRETRTSRRPEQLAAALTRESRFSRILPASPLALLILSLLAPIACESSNRDEPIGKTTTVEKRTVETPDGTATVTETTEKETKIVR